MNNADDKETRTRSITRRRFLQYMAAAALVPITGAGAKAGPEPLYTDRAIAAYDVMQAFLYRSRLFDNEATLLYVPDALQHDSHPYSFVWPFSLAMAGTIDLYSLPSAGTSYLSDIHDRVLGADAYWDGRCFEAYVMPPLGPGGNRYWDDNAWLGLNLVRVYRITGDRAALRRARQVFDYMVEGWDTDAGHPAPGGVFWMEAPWNRDRATISSGGAAELGLRLYQQTGEEKYLTWAVRMYYWANRNMLDTDGLYWDHIDLQGHIDKGKASYTQGTMVGAGGLLYQVTGDTTYREIAKRTALQSLRYYGANGYATMDPTFNAIFLRNMLYFSTIDRDHLPATLQVMQRYTDGLWAVRQQQTGLFKYPLSDALTTLEIQSAATCIFACLACDPAKYDLLL
jgi:rhamnogalacturonyl hydrolase YesR